jgi:hypothetical protein
MKMRAAKQTPEFATMDRVAVGAGEVEEIFRPFDEGALFWPAGDGYAAAAAEVE